MAKLAKMTYGKALLDLAVEQNLVDALFEEAVAVEKILKDEPDFLLLMTHPKIPLIEKKKPLIKYLPEKCRVRCLDF